MEVRLLQRVENSHVLKSNKGINNTPGGGLSAGALTEKLPRPETAIAIGLRLLRAISFVESAEDLHRTRQSRRNERQYSRTSRFGFQNRARRSH